MIEEILSDIRKAEKEAADKVASAESRAEEIRAEAEAESARILEKAASDAKIIVRRRQRAQRKKPPKAGIYMTPKHCASAPN